MQSKTPVVTSSSKQVPPALQSRPLDATEAVSFLQTSRLAAALSRTLLPPPPSLLPSPLPHPQTPPSRLQPPLACDVTPSAVTDPVSKCVTFPLLSLYPQNPPPSLLVGINSLIAEGHTAVGKTSKAVQRPNLLFVSRLF